MGAVSVTGFWFQLTYFWGLPFPLNVLLLPASVAERVLMYFVANAAPVAASA